MRLWYIYNVGHASRKSKYRVQQDNLFCTDVLSNLNRAVLELRYINYPKYQLGITAKKLLENMILLITIFRLSTL